jgi:diguanylate cyclase (GGDEF)-like protein/PAS domain S-box-containing protein
LTFPLYLKSPELNVSLDWLVLQSLIDASPDGVVVCDARGGKWPVVYCNGSFEQLTGYRSSEIQGRGLSFLQQGEDTQEGLTLIRAALREGVACRTVLRNYRKDGSPFVNEMQLIPIRDQQSTLTHFASFHRVGSERSAATIGEAATDAMLSTQRLLAHVREDKQTGLLRRSYFEDLLRRDFSLAQREQKLLTLIAFEIDHANAYREVFGPSGAEQTFKRVARTVAGCFRRASDLCARWEDSQIVAATMTTDATQALRLAETVAARVRDLAIHHPRAAASRYVTVSLGVVSAIPDPKDNASQFIVRALQSMRSDQGASALQKVAR